MRWIIAAIFLCCASDSFSAKLPSDFKRCDRKQADVGKCLQEAIEDAIPKLKNPNPKLGMPSIEPLEIPEIHIGSGGGTVAVDQNYKDVRLHGFSTMKVDKIGFDFSKNVLHAAVTIPRLKSESMYEVSGQLLVFPVQGTGPTFSILEDVKITVDLPFKEIDKGGSKYFKFEGVKMSLEPGNVMYQFDNLFNGDKALGDNINKVLNENWKPVWDDVKHGFEEAYGLIVQNLCNIIFTKVPISDIFLNE